MITTRFRRPHAALLLATYLATGGVALWGEARFGAADATPTHVEAAGQHPCDVGHDHDSCLACRSLSSLGLPVAGAASAPLGPLSCIAAPSAPDPAVSRPGLRLPASRAPPALVRPA